MLARIPNMINTFDPRIRLIVDITRQYLTNVTRYDSAETSLILDYREYVDGDQPAALTETQAALLGNDLDYTLNVTETIVSVIADRLKARGVEVVETEEEHQQSDMPETPVMPDMPNPEAMEAGGMQESAPDMPMQADVAQTSVTEQINAVIRKLWDKNQMDNRQADIAWMSGRDGAVFIMPEYNTEKGYVQWAINPAFDGTTGVRMIYSEDNYEPLYAVKRWSIVPHPAALDQTTTLKRMNVYYPDRVEKWVSKGAASAGNTSNWQPLDPANVELITTEHGTYKATVSWWTDAIVQVETVNPDGTVSFANTIGRNGKPLGIPVFHFKANAQGNAQGKSDIAQIVPGQQDVINRANAMTSAAEQFMSTPTIYIITDGTVTELQLFPGSPVQLPKDSQVFIAPAADIDALNRSVDAKIARAFKIARIPTSYAISTGQVAAEGTLKQQEVLLTARVEKRQMQHGNAYESLVRMSLKMMAMFDPEFTLFTVETLDALDDLSLSCSWEPAEIRNETEDAQRAVTEKRDLEFPIEIYGNTAGLTTDEIAMIKRGEADKQQADLAARETQTNQVLARMADAMAGVSSNGQSESGNGAENPNGEQVGQLEQV